MLVIRDTSSVPPEGWVYTVQATGFTVRVPSYGLLYEAIVGHCRANSVPTPTEQEVIDACCRDLHVPCFEMETKTPLVNKFSLNLPVPASSCCGSAKK